MIPRVRLPGSRTMIALGRSLTLEAIRGATLPSGPLHTFAAGESQPAAGVRRHLVNDRGVPRRDISFFGYWRPGRSTPR
ncbi:SIP domain-containing protein [Streptomyces sp. NPDC088812]|uniref:SIP domain-containing protein n=1 Tax=Streptomyces sp. NPDC088812 TaxID=3365905 RepID=UPI0038305BA4